MLAGRTRRILRGGVFRALEAHARERGAQRRLHLRDRPAHLDAEVVRVRAKHRQTLRGRPIGDRLGILIERIIACRHFLLADAFAGGETGQQLRKIAHPERHLEVDCQAGIRRGGDGGRGPPGGDGQSLDAVGESAPFLGRRPGGPCIAEQEADARQDEDQCDEKPANRRGRVGFHVWGKWDNGKMCEASDGERKLATGGLRGARAGYRPFVGALKGLQAR